MRFLPGFAVVAVAALTAASPAFAVTCQIVALSGQQAPGMPEGVVFGSLATYVNPFPNPGIDNTGMVTIKSYTTSSSNAGLWAGQPGNLHLLAHTGLQPPGVPEGITYGLVNGAYNFISDGHGQVMFSAPLTGDAVGTNDTGIWWGRPGDIHLLVRDGQPMPGIEPGVATKSPGLAGLGAKYSFNNGWATLFRNLTGEGITGDNDVAVWSGRPDDLRLVAREGEAASGMPAGSRLRSIYTYFSPRTNSTGHAILFASADGIDAAGSKPGIWLSRPDELSVLAFQSGPAPGFPEGTISGNISPPLRPGSIAAEDWTAATGSVALNGSTVEAVWAGKPGEWEVVARDGLAAPGLGSGGLLKIMQTTDMYGPLVNSHGDVVFRAEVVDNLERAESLWARHDGQLQMIARAGDFSPDHPLSTLPALGIEASGSFAFNFRTALLNDPGQVVVDGRLNGKAIYLATDTLGRLTVAAQEGMPLETSDGQRWILTSILSTTFPSGSTSDGRWSALNDAGQLSFAAVLEDEAGTVQKAAVVVADLNVPGVTAGILTGVNQRGEVVGAPGDPGHVAVTFPTAEAGILRGDYYTTEWHETPLPSLVLSPDGRAQYWGLTFTGSFDEGAILELKYDESLLPPGLDESLLGIYHGTQDGWELLPGSVDTANNLLTVTTTSFCNFALGVVPEPATFALIVPIALALLKRCA